MPACACRASMRRASRAGKVQCVFDKCRPARVRSPATASQPRAAVHVHHKPLYQVIGRPRVVTQRYRRRGAAPHVARCGADNAQRRLAQAASEKNRNLASLMESTVTEPLPETPTQAESPPASELPGTFPIGLAPDGRAVVFYVTTELWTDDFRSFLQRHAALLRVAPMWTLRLVFPRPLDRAYDAY